MKIAVVGVGTIGSQILRYLAKVPGIEVHGFEMHYPGHPYAAAGGESRLFRSFEFGNSMYQQTVVEKADNLWRDLEMEAGRSLINRTGALVFGNEKSRSLQQLIRIANTTGRKFDLLDSQDLKRVHPEFNWDSDELGLWDPLGGIIRPELSILSSARLAEHNGAQIHCGNRVDQIHDSGKDFEVTVGGEGI